MVGEKSSKDKLNKTLLFITDLFNNNNINNWFISYGTLLGIIRENSCIENDDDIDICCNIKDYLKIKNILINNKINLILNEKHILKTRESLNYCSIDFYLCEIDNKYNFNDKWNGVIWSNCYLNGKQIEYKWNNIILYIPNNYEKKLEGRYGKNWKIPQNSKGPEPIKKIL